MKKILTTLGLACLTMLFSGISLAQPAPGPMSFFVTSTGSGNGGNLGGLAGADAICQSLAEAPRAQMRLMLATVSAAAHGITPREH